MDVIIVMSQRGAAHHIHYNGNYVDDLDTIVMENDE